jgi:hypothetical protein
MLLLLGGVLLVVGVVLARITRAARARRTHGIAVDKDDLLRADLK